MKPSEARKLTFMLWDRYPHAKREETTLEGYANGIRDLRFDDVAEALGRIVRTSECAFPPTVAKVRRSVLEAKQGPRRTGEEAWGIALQGIRKFGRDTVPKFSDRTITQVVRMWGGWCAFCNSPESDSMADRARFINLYNDMSLKSVESHLAAPGLLPPAPDAQRRLQDGSQSVGGLIGDLASKMTTKTEGSDDE